MTGIEGQVELAGYKAVLATFIRWTLERRGETSSGEPRWFLRASMSFQKDSMLLNSKLAKKIRVKSHMGEWILEPVPGAEYKVENAMQLVVEGVVACPVQRPQK